MEQRRFPVMVDMAKGYPCKPSTIEGEVKNVRKRMQREKPHMLTSTELLALVRDGHTWQPGCYRKNDFVGQQVYGLDFDKPELLMPDECLARLHKLGLWQMASLLYFTHSATHECPKYRLVLVDDEPAKEFGVAKERLHKLLSLFPEADQACKDTNRMFFGTDDRFQAWDIDAYMGGEHVEPAGRDRRGRGADLEAC